MLMDFDLLENTLAKVDWREQIVFDIENGVLKGLKCKKGLKEVIIPDGVTEIGQKAFWGIRTCLHKRIHLSF